MRKHDILKSIGAKGVVAVIRALDTESGRQIADAVYGGGIPAVEITMTVPGALDVMKDLARTYGEDSLILGAGTVLDAETAKLCLLAGAQYIVTPFLSPEVIKTCNRYGVPCLPGVGSVTELVSALELGVDVVKIFPGEVLKPAFIKAVHGPLPGANMMPTGGVSPDNLEEWITAGAFAVGMGSALTKPAGKSGDYTAITDTARRVVSEIARIRKSLK